MSTRFIEIDSKLVMQLISSLPHDELPEAMQVFRVLLHATTCANRLLTRAAKLQHARPSKRIH
jgi:hypothetical protein